jgi:polar amino acid transport system substrate-binding protein
MKGGNRMKAKGLMVVFLAVLVMLGAASSFAAPDVLDEILAAGVIKVSTDPNYAPQSFIADNGQLDGFDVNVAQEVAKRLGVKIEFVTPEWDMITSGKWGKRWDLSVGSMTPTAERKKVLMFTKAYYYTPAQFAIHKKNSDIKSLKDLAGKIIGTCSECTYDRWLNRDLVLLDQEVTYADWKPGKIVTYKTDADAIQDLALGDGVRLHAVLSAKATLFEAIEAGCGGGCPLKMIGDPVFYDSLSFAIDRSRAPSEKYLAKLEEILAAMHADGTLTRLSMKWYGVDLTKKAGE